MLGNLCNDFAALEVTRRRMESSQLHKSCDYDFEVGVVAADDAYRKRVVVPELEKSPRPTLDVFKSLVVEEVSVRPDVFDGRPELKKTINFLDDELALPSAKESRISRKDVHHFVVRTLERDPDFLHSV